MTVAVSDRRLRALAMPVMVTRWAATLRADAIAFLMFSLAAGLSMDAALMPANVQV